MNTPAKRILYVEGNVDGTIGGSYYSLFFLVSGLDRRRFEPVVVFATDNPLVPRLHAGGIQTIIRRPPNPTVLFGRSGRLIAKTLNFLRGWILEPMRLARLLRREGIALVHLNNSVIRNHTWMIGARLVGIPCITHERGINARFPRRARLLARRLSAVICISQAVQDNFVACGLADLKMATIHNGLDPAEMHVTRDPHDIRAELGISTAARVIGIVGNIKPWKGQEVVIRAVAQLRDRFPDLVCLLIGDTSPGEASYRDRLLELIKQLGLTASVVITGFRSDVANYVNALEIQVHASVSPEPFGRVLLEGMALSKPLIASNAGAVPEIVQHGTTGLLFEPNSPDSLADCLTKLLTEPDLARCFGEEGRRRLDTEFSIHRNVLQTEQVYERLIGR